jgi:hypothetical protein
MSPGKTGETRHFASLFAVLVLVTTVSPFLAETTQSILLSRLVFSTLLLIGIYSVSPRRSVLLWGLALALPALAAKWASHFWPATVLVAADFSLSGAFCVYITAIVLRQILSADRVSGDTLLGGICVYLLLGVIWTLLFMLLEALHPGSFLMAGEPLGAGANRSLSALLYYSFVTLTTLGYGDVVPVSAAARALAVSEAIAGQLYLTVFVAALVGMHLVHTRSDPAR